MARNKPNRGNSMKIAIFEFPVIINNNLTQIICSLILSTRYPLNLNVNLIIFGAFYPLPAPASTPEIK